MFDSFVTRDLGRDYPDLVSSVLEYGHEVSPRGMRVREVTGFKLELKDPARSVVSRPGFSRALMYMEIAQLISGRFDQDLYAKISPQAASMLTSFGAYGPRVKGNLRVAADVLQEDPDSRRAVVFVGAPDDMLVVAYEKHPHTDQPCTLTWQFLIRNQQLEMIVNMRSWDLVWGLSYDVPCFTAVQRLMAWALGVVPGRYVHFAGSAHVYERHFDLALRPNQSSTLSLPFLDDPPIWHHAQDNIHAQQLHATAALSWWVDAVPQAGWEPAVEAWGKYRS